jgi:hypothetical protein
MGDYWEKWIPTPFDHDEMPEVRRDRGQRWWWWRGSRWPATCSAARVAVGDTGAVAVPRELGETSWYEVSKSISKSLPNFTWQILCFANFLKDMTSKKKSSSPTVWHNSLDKFRSKSNSNSSPSQELPLLFAIVIFLAKTEKIFSNSSPS